MNVFDPQACCKSFDGGETTQCDMLTPCECFMELGSPKGAGTTCEDMCQDDFGNPLPDGNCIYCNFEACCTRDFFGGDVIDGGCFDGTREACEQNRLSGESVGFPQGVGTRCKNHGCGTEQNPMIYGACCLQDGTCTEVTGEGTFGRFNACASLAGIYRGDHTRCTEEANFCYGDNACCLDNGSCVDITYLECCEAGGRPQLRGATCANSPLTCEEFLPDGCRETEPDVLPPGGREWLSDLSTNVAFVPYRRKPHEYPEPGTPEAKRFRPGFIEWIAVTPTRSIDLNSSDLNNGVNPCRYPLGRLYRHNGYFRVAYCAIPHGDKVNERTNHVADAFKVRNDNEHLKVGSRVMLGPIRLPWFFEAHYYSNELWCQGVDR